MENVQLLIHAIWELYINNSISKESPTFADFKNDGFSYLFVQLSRSKILMRSNLKVNAVQWSTFLKGLIFNFKKIEDVSFF